MAANHLDVQFEQRKRSGIEAISVCELDKSPKGSVDLPIRDLVSLINLHRDYCTTSSCSGRISLFHTGGEETTAKGRGFWFLALHRALESPTELERALATGLAANPSPSSITLFKHEPFVLHVLCRTVPLAQAMLLVARESGFRESGISSSNDHKIILAVRTTSNVLEVPVAFNGEPVCPPEYLAFLSQQANLKFAENVKRVEHFYQGLQALFQSQASSQAPTVAAASPTTWRPIENCKFKRWGHACVVLDEHRVLLFGGWKENARTNDTCIWDSRHRALCPVESPLLPPALVYHTATKVGSADVLVFGGRTSPQSPSSELWKFASERWELVSSGSGPVARFRHAACSQGNSLFVFGGRAADGQALGDLWEFANGAWSQVVAVNEGPGRVFAHAMVAFGDKLYVHGGLTNELVERKDSRVHVLDLHTKEWSVVETGGIPWRFSHSWVSNFAKPSETFMSGGVLDQCSAKVLGLEEALQVDLDTEKVRVKRLQFTCECELLAVQHSFAVLDQDTMVVFGGGATCFAFGSVYSPSAQLGGELSDQSPTAPATGQLYLKCAKPQAVEVKKALEQLDALDKSRKVEHVDQFLCFPVLFPVSTIPNAETTSLEPSVRTKADTKQQQQQLEHDLCVRLFGSATGKIERVDDVLLVPGTLTAVSESDWKLLLSLYPGSTRVVQRERVSSNAMRQSRNTLVYSSVSPATPAPECWVTRVENGVTFSFDMLQVMYSKGNVSEKLRFSQLVQPGETVLDLFAGIGYFTLPALKLAKPSKVYSCELNRHSVRALRRNLVLNGIDPARSQVFPGDCRHFAKENFANRVSLGLLPDARVGFPTACRAVVNGGWLHIHENVNESDVDSWGVSVAQEITTLLNSVRPVGQVWVATCEYISRVKSYAPRVLHVVGDVRCQLVEGQPAGGAVAVAASSAPAPSSLRPLPRSPAMQELALELRWIADSLLCDTQTSGKEAVSLAADAELLFKRIGATLKERVEEEV